MKKRFITVGITCVILVTAASVYAGNIIMNDVSMLSGQNTEISVALAENNSLRHFNEEDTDNGIAVMSITPEQEAKYNQTKAIQCYSIFDVEDKDSILKYLDREPNIVVPIERESDVVGFATLNKGISLEKAEEILDAKEITGNDKKDLMAEAEKRAGKLYVSSVMQLSDDFETATLYFNKNTLAQIIAEQIGDEVTDGKYVRIVRDNMYAYVFIAGEEEYIIPYDLSVHKELENGKVYTVEKAIETMREAY